jgi:hypothetical protein
MKGKGAVLVPRSATPEKASDRTDGTLAHLFSGAHSREEMLEGIKYDTSSRELR